MPRPPLPIGTYGPIRTEKVEGGVRAFTRFRDHDGITRKVERVGPNVSAATNRLREDLRDRGQYGGGDDLHGESRFREAAERWIETVDLLVAQGLRSPNTTRLYKLNLTTYVLPAIGELRLREVTVPRLDRMVQALHRNSGAAAAKVARTVSSGVLGMAVRHGAIPTNPARDIGRIANNAKRQPRSLSAAERQRWLDQLRADPVAVRKDLPDLCELMLGTGIRIGEALALSWAEIDLDAAAVRIDHTLIRIDGVGLTRKGTKSVAGERTLALPEFVVAMLRRRALAADGAGPVFPDTRGGWRDPSNTSRDLRNARGSTEFSWVTSHVFRKTAATVMDELGLPARLIADQLGHARVSMTQNVYLGRRTVGREAAAALDHAYRQTQRHTGPSPG